MDKAKIDDLELEYEMSGSGEAVLMISPVIADAFGSFMTVPELAGHYCLIRYHRRGWCGSTRTRAAASIAEHAADAAALLEYLDVSAAHVIGHSSGANIALQFASDRPDLVYSLVLLEPTMLSVPEAGQLLADVQPALEAYAAGRPAEAVTAFLAVVSGMTASTCQAVIEEHVPGGIAMAIADADTFFGVELPSLGAWPFEASHAARITQPTLSVLGGETGQLWRAVAALLHAWLPRLEERTIPGVGHLLELQHPAPVARAAAEFLRRHPLPASGARVTRASRIPVPARAASRHPR